jgi:hypothetical protein
MRLMIISLFIGVVFAPWAEGLQTPDRIVVTGSRIDRFGDDQVPATLITRRADELSVEISIEGDTRDRDQRILEIRRTLRRVFEAAGRNPLIQLDIEITREIGDDYYEVIEPFTAAMIDSVSVRNGSRADTSIVVLRATTPIRQQDNLQDIENRLETFIEGVDVVGRSLVDLYGDIDLIIAGGPARYRQELIAEIATDAHATAEQFGPDFAIEISGLEDAIRWQRHDELSLQLYINYDLTVRN